MLPFHLEPTLSLVLSSSRMQCWSKTNSEGQRARARESEASYLLQCLNGRVFDPFLAFPLYHHHIRPIDHSNHGTSRFQPCPR
jgi:hypothetical protein